MNKIIEKYIGIRIDIILNEFNFQKRKKEHPEECPCNSPCHEIEKLNCFFCYCPFYKNDKPEGGCTLENPLRKGKWFYRAGHELSDKIWDCSECAYPHMEENIKAILRDLFGGGLYHSVKEASENIDYKK